MAQTARGWPYPVGTDKVVDGDNQMKAISDRLDAFNGMTLIRTTAVAASSDFWMDGVFTNLYSCYRLIGQFSASAATAVNMSVRAAGVTFAGANAYGNTRLWNAAGNTVSALAAPSTAWTLAGVGGTGIWFDFTLFNNLPSPYKFAGHGMISSYGGAVLPALGNWSGYVGNGNAYDGIRIGTGSITMTGTWSVFGVRA